MDEQLPSPRANSTVIFGKYEMGRLLGQGTFAKVYYGRNVVTNDNVAIKVISKDLVKKAGMMDQIKREISVMSLVRHPNIVELKEVMATKTKIYFVMEYVKGGELFARVERGRLKESQARKYFQQLISAVDFCHSRGVSHRDLKPENLLVDENGNLKVSDFGLSALPEQRRQDGLLHTQCGTPAYVAPEVIRKKGYAGEKSDLWSCGVILFVLLAGYLPFQDENVMRMYSKIFKAEYQFPPWFPAEAKRLVMKLLVVDPTKRLSIDGIMRVPWFLKGFTRPASQEFSSDLISDEDKTHHDAVVKSNNSVDESQSPPSSITSTAPFLNAFEFISSLSSGFDLSSLFTEKKRRSRSIFTSKLSGSSLMTKIESAAKKLNFSVSSSKEYYGVKMEGKTEGRKGRLTVAAEVYEVAPELAVVEFTKCSGDTLEYVRFCDEEVRPALKDIVWSWQGVETN